MTDAIGVRHFPHVRILRLAQPPKGLQVIRDFLQRRLVVLVILGVQMPYRHPPCAGRS
ncbi:MAG: hypothetical protein JRH18_03495 [Deltaproteobacteria bacterium]|nr:hypothetical protein [Deltaproteobacteria bacterium]MBW2150713.1 hypothetical protein [Deltaproteobacteria bacterium]